VNVSVVNFGFDFVGEGRIRFEGRVQREWLYKRKYLRTSKCGSTRSKEVYGRKRVDETGVVEVEFGSSTTFLVSGRGRAVKASVCYKRPPEGKRC
jgi:hypothetical protein